MHEISLIKTILETVKKEMTVCGAKKLNSITLRVGTLTAVEPVALRFAFNSSIEKTDMQNAVLEIVESKLKGRCRDCGTGFNMTELDSLCPICGGGDVKRVSGTELDIISIDVD